MAKQKKGGPSKGPGRPPVPSPAFPTHIVDDVPGHPHTWEPGRLYTIDRIQFRYFSCECGATGNTVEFHLREDVFGQAPFGDSHGQ